MGFQLQVTFLGLLAVSIAFATDSKPLVKKQANFPFSNPIPLSFGSNIKGPSTPAPFVFEKSFTTPAPLKSVSYSSTPAPFNSESPLFANNFGSNTGSIQSFYSNGPTDQSLEGAFVSSAAFVKSSTPSTFVSGPAVSDASIAYSSTPASDFIDGPTLAPTFPASHIGPAPAVSKNSPAFATTYSSGSYVPAFAQGAITKSESYNGGAIQANAPNRQVILTKEVAVPYYVQVEKKVPYPVLVHIPEPYPVAVEKHVPYAVKVNVDRPIHIARPYPVEIEKKVPYPVEKPVPYEIKVPVERPYPVPVPFEKTVPYAVEKPVPYPVRVNVDRPYPVVKEVPYPVTVEKQVPYPVEKQVPYPVEKLVPYPVEKNVPYPVKYEVPVKVPVPVEVRVPVKVDRPVPYPVEKRVPYPVRVPVEVRVPVPVQTPAQRFATVHYYEQSPVSVQSTQAVVGQSSGYESFGVRLQNNVPNVYYNTPASSAIPVNNQNAAGAASASNSGNAAFYSSINSPASTTASPVNAYSISAAGLSGSNVTPEGLVGFNEAQKTGGALSSALFNNNGPFFGSSTPASFDRIAESFSAGPVSGV